MARYDHRNLLRKGFATNGFGFPNAGTSQVSVLPLKTRLATLWDNAWIHRPSPITAVAGNPALHWLTRFSPGGSPLYVAAGLNYSGLAYSSDSGATWTQSSMLGTSYVTGRPIIYSNQIFWCLGNMGTGFLAYSTNTFTGLTSVSSHSTGQRMEKAFQLFNSGTGTFWVYYYTAGTTDAFYASSTPTTNGSFTRVYAGLTGRINCATYSSSWSGFLIGQNAGVLKHLTQFTSTVTNITSPFSGSYDVWQIGVINYMGSGSVAAVTKGGEIAYSTTISGTVPTWTLATPFVSNARGFMDIKFISYNGNPGNWFWAFLTYDGHVLQFQFNSTNLQASNGVPFASGQVFDITPGGSAGPPLINTLMNGQTDVRGQFEILSWEEGSMNNNNQLMITTGFGNGYVVSKKELKGYQL
jgi:hypothetical protein